MNLTEKDSDIVRRLLAIEHSATAMRLGFIKRAPATIDIELVHKAVGLLDAISRVETQRARRFVVTLSAILWTYRSQEWDGLKEFLVLILSRAGFAPSSIMIDDEYDHVRNRFSMPIGLVNQFAVALAECRQEVFVGGLKFLLTDFQKRTWEKLHQVRLLGISAPTSAGKSFLILLKAVDLLLKKDGNVVYIVPTLSLVSQVASDFHERLRQFNLNAYRVSTTFSSQDAGNRRVYVLTQEKAIAAFTQQDVPFGDVRLLVVDEIQNLERVAHEDDQRAKTLYDTLIEFRYSCDPALTIISGPRIEGLKGLGEKVFDEASSDEEKSIDSPVASFTYSIAKDGETYHLKQYCELVKTPHALPIDGTSIRGYGQSLYKAEFLKYLSLFVTRLGTDSRNIIFSPTSDQARKTAAALAASSHHVSIDDSITSLVAYIRETVHFKYALCDTLPKGFAYHHGKMPTHVRLVVERAIRDKLVPNVVCTTTLMQGVNLPAQNVILRNPYLAVKSRQGEKPQLTEYEIANLRGRAGRLLKDFIGRTFVLEEAAFEGEAETMDLFPEAEKKLSSGYGGAFEDHKSEILEHLGSNTPPSAETSEYAYLLTHIRQCVLRHGAGARHRLNAVGIELGEQNIKTILSAMAELDVPTGICHQNRYWDPVDLDSLYAIRNEIRLPTSILESDIEGALERVLRRMSVEYTHYYARYFGVADELLRSACITAKDWMKERSLKAILSNRYYDTPEKIDRQITLIQSKIAYGLPMLLKPLYDMKAADQMFLRFVEMGAYQPVTRKMIELNVPRETALSLTKQLFNGIIVEPDGDVEGFVLDTLRRHVGRLQYWERVQLESVL